MLSGINMKSPEVTVVGSKEMDFREAIDALDITVIITTYNRSELLAEALDSLEQMYIPDDLSYEIIVIDNNSEDNTKEIAGKFVDRGKRNFRYVFEGNQGLSYARNRGIQEAKGKIVAFTDDDQLVDPMWISSLWKTFQEYDTDCVGGKILYSIPESAPRWLKKFLSDEPRGVGQLDMGPKAFIVETKYDIPKGGNMAFKKSVIQSHGCFDVHLGRKGKALLGGEETKLLRDMLGSGCSVVYQPKAVVHHLLESQKLSKSYWRNIFFGAGRTFVLMSGPHGHLVDLRHLLGSVRRLIPCLLRWACFTAVLQFGRAFKNELIIRMELGIIYQSLRT